MKTTTGCRRYSCSNFHYRDFIYLGKIIPSRRYTDWCIAYRLKPKKCRKFNRVEIEHLGWDDDNDPVSCHLASKGYHPWY